MQLDRQKGWLADWVRQLLAHHHSNHVVCALANKLARVAWAIAAHHTEFDAGASRDERLTCCDHRQHPTTPGFAMLDKLMDAERANRPDDKP
nr:hypothetical protein [Pseudomonas fluorescens]